MPEITQERLNELESNSRMLGQIGAYVEDFCKDEEDTTLIGVLRLLSAYHSLESDAFDHAVDWHKKHNK